MRYGRSFPKTANNCRADGLPIAMASPGTSCPLVCATFSAAATRNAHSARCVQCCKWGNSTSTSFVVFTTRNEKRGTVLTPFGDAEWGGKFGALHDRFGTEWFVTAP